MTPEERFWAKVDRTDGCWLWTGCHPGGYGQFWLNGRMVQAHRYAYELLVGPIPDGHQIDHVKARGCVHTHCVRPDHLEPVTPLENNARSDSFSAKEARQTHCIHGHPFDQENTVIRRSGRRRCRTCARATKKAAKRRARQRATAPATPTE